MRTDQYRKTTDFCQTTSFPLANQNFFLEKSSSRYVLPGLSFQSVSVLQSCRPLQVHSCRLPPVSLIPLDVTRFLLVARPPLPSAPPSRFAPPPTHTAGFGDCSATNPLLCPNPKNFILIFFLNHQQNPQTKKTRTTKNSTPSPILSSKWISPDVLATLVS